MKKQYFAPKFKVVEIKEADIICTSGGTEAYGEGNTDDWFNS